MLDWGSRIDDLADKLAREYTIEDRPAIEILLGSLLPCPRTAASWLILEIPWFSRECLDAWFSFGEQWVPCSLSRLRARGPWRAIEAETAAWLEAPDDEHLFIECDYERYPRFDRLTQAQYILQRSLRIRTRTTRAADPLYSLDQRAQERRTDELAAATRFVLEDRVQARPADPPRFLPPADFLYHCELIQRLAPWYPDWHILTRAFALVGVRHAHLYGRWETTAEDHAAMARVARDSVPPWIAKALELLRAGPRETPTLEKHMALEEKSRRSGHGAHRELVRLHRAGIVHWNKQAQHWALVEDHRQGISDVLGGKAFGAAGGGAGREIPD